MTDDEVRKLIDHVNASWGRAPYKEEVTSQRKAWTVFVHDLSYDDVLRVVNEMALYSQYTPKPGDVRRRVMAGKIPDPLEAWGMLQQVRHAINSGSSYTGLSGAVKLVYDRLGDQALGLHTNGDRDRFCETYERVMQEWLAEKCKVIPR